MRGYGAGLRAAGLVHLQGVGDMPGKPAGDLQAGDVVVHNFGYTYKVLGKRKVSPLFWEVTTASTETGEIYHRKYRSDRLVAVERHRHTGHSRTR